MAGTFVVARQLSVATSLVPPEAELTAAPESSHPSINNLPTAGKSNEQVWPTERAPTGKIQRVSSPKRQAASTLAKRPCDLRHAAVSTWLNAGVQPTLVAEWAGHSVQVLLRVHAKCIEGQDAQSRKLIEGALVEPKQGKTDSGSGGPGRV